LTFDQGQQCGLRYCRLHGQTKTSHNEYYVKWRSLHFEFLQLLGIRHAHAAELVASPVWSVGMWLQESLRRDLSVVADTIDNLQLNEIAIHFQPTVTVVVNTSLAEAYDSSNAHNFA
jgi:hypothetical protein